MAITDSTSLRQVNDITCCHCCCKATTSSSCDTLQLRAAGGLILQHLLLLQLQLQLIGRFWCTTTPAAACSLLLLQTAGVIAVIVACALLLQLLLLLCCHCNCRFYILSQLAVDCSRNPALVIGRDQRNRSILIIIFSWLLVAQAFSKRMAMQLVLECWNNCC